MDLSAATGLNPGTPVEPWKVAFFKYWKIAHSIVGSNFEITCERFLPKLDATTGLSPTGDFRWSPNTDENPDQAADEAVWVYGTGTTWAEYNSLTLTGATEVIIGAASAAVIALLTF